MTIMILNAGLLYAAICPFILELLHFTTQRTLKDRRTILFCILILCGFFNVLSGLFLTGLIPYHENQLCYKLEQMVLLCVYFSEFIFPYILLELAARNCRHTTSGFLKLARFVEVCCFLAILSNPLTHWLSYLETNGVPRIGIFYPVFVAGMLVWYFVDLMYTFYYRKSMRNRQWIPFMEASVLMMFGIMLQNILHIRLVTGYMAALVTAILYFSTQNRYAYMDLTTSVFNADYFNYWLWEQLQYHKDVHVIAIYLSNMEKIRIKFGVDREIQKLIAKELWKMTPEHRVFRVRTNKYAICTKRIEDHFRLLQQLQTLLDSEISVNGRSIRCSAVLAEVVHAEQKFLSVEEMMSYVSVLLHPGIDQLDVQVIHDTEKQRADYETEKKIEQYIVRALAEDLFDVWYQPVYSVIEKRFVGVEALSRLYHPELGWINPELFINLATKDGQIYQLMPMQLHRICRFLKRNQTLLERLWDIKINLSPSEIIKQGYVEGLIDIIRSYHIPLEKFQFEVTESAATDYTTELNHCIGTLQKNGIRLCLDDFGSGYANLSSVLRLPFSIIKMDRSLLQGIMDNKENAVFYHSMVQTLHALGYQIVSEGVETIEEVQMLEDWKVDFIQGFYYSRPLSEQNLEKLLLK